MTELGSLLGRWHQWRRGYTHERGYARVQVDPRHIDTEEQLEELVMRTIEAEVSAMPPSLQRAIQHVARAECLGVEVLIHPELANKSVREPLVQHALRELHRRLDVAGVV